MSEANVIMLHINLKFYFDVYFDIDKKIRMLFRYATLGNEMFFEVISQNCFHVLQN